MRKKLALIAALVSSTFIAVLSTEVQDEVPSNKPTPHGYAKIHVVHNDTPFSAQFFKDPTSLVQRIPVGAEFRLKGYFANNYYYWRVVKIGDTWKLSCTWPAASGGKDDDDNATVFSVVKKYASNDAVVIASHYKAFAKDKTQKIIAVNKNTYEIELIDYKDGDPRNTWSEWKFAGREAIGAVDFDNVWLGNPAAAGAVKGQLAFLAARSTDHEIKRLKKELEPYVSTLGPLDSLEDLHKKNVPYIDLKWAQWGRWASWYEEALDNLNAWLGAVQKIAKVLSQVIIDAGTKKGESLSDWQSRIASKMIDASYRAQWQAIVDAGGGDPANRVNTMLVPGGGQAQALALLQWAQIAMPDIKQALTQRDYEDIQKHGVKSFELSNNTHPTEYEYMAFSKNLTTWQRSMFGVWLLGSPKRLDIIISDSGAPNQQLPSIWQNDALIIKASPEGIRRLASWDRLVALYEQQERGEESPDDGAGYVGDKTDPNLGQFQNGFYTPWDGDMTSIQLLSETSQIVREGSIINAGGSSDINDIYVAQQPEMKGHGYERIEEFGPEKSVTLNSFFADGFAWLEQSMLYPWQGTLIFSAKPGDDGNVRIALGTATGPDAEYLIVIGDDNNTVSRIYKKRVFKKGESSEVQFEAAVTVVPKKGIPREVMPCVRPGRMESFWVSLNNGLIVVGKGEPGIGIIMAWKDPDYKQVNKIGFSAYGTSTVYQDVQQIDYPLVSKVSWKQPYVTIDKVSVGKGRSPAWLPLPLSPADAGAVEFSATGDGDFSLCFVQDPKLVQGEANKGYDIVFGAQGVAINRHENPNDVVVTSDIKVNRAQKLWVSLYKGMIIVGQGEFGQSPFLFWQDWFTRDESVLQGIARVGFAALKGNVTIGNVALWPEVEIGFGDVKTKYEKKGIDFVPIRGALEVVAPFWYRGFQDGPLVRVRDLYSNRLLYLESTPRPGATYTYDLKLTKDGKASFVLMGFEKSPYELELQRRATIETRSAEATEYSASIMSRSGIESASASIAVTASVGLLAGAVLSRVLAASDEAKLSEIQSLAQRYIPPPDQITRSTAQLAELPANVQNAVNNIKSWYANPAIKLEDALEKYNNIMDNMIAFACLDAVPKKSIIDGISALYKNVTDRGLDSSTYALYAAMFTILLKAYNNPYLIDRIDPQESQRRREWYLWANEIFQAIYKNRELQRDDGIDIKFKGEYLWLPEEDKLQKPGRGFFTFEVKADSDAFVGFAQASDPTRNSGKPMYEIVIGKWGNTKTEISRKSLGDPVASFDQESNTYSELSLDPLAFQRYWVNVCDGKILIGRDIPDAKKKSDQAHPWGCIAMWSDPYPAQKVTTIGLSSWYAGVAVRNMKVAPALQDMTLAQIKGLEGTSAEKVTPSVGISAEK